MALKKLIQKLRELRQQCEAHKEDIDLLLERNKISIMVQNYKKLRKIKSI